MGVRLLQVHTLGWAIQRYLALFTATLRTYAPVDRRTETLFLPFFADGAGQTGLPRPLWHAGIVAAFGWGAQLPAETRQLAGSGPSGAAPNFPTAREELPGF